jgi:aryl sulfotransferase
MQTLRAERLRDYSGPITNTDIWDDFQLRSDDVIVCTPPKSGTTWTLNIIMMLIHGQVIPNAGSKEEAPWLDCAFRDRSAIAARQAALTRRRCVKTHTPLDGISYAVEPSYIVVYRHPVDAHFSFRSHIGIMKFPGRMKGLFPDDVDAGFNRFLDGTLTDAGTDDFTLASIVHHYQEARAREQNGNVHFFHYADMSRDLHGQIARLAGILKIDQPQETLAALTEANTFANVRKAAEASETRFNGSTLVDDRAKFFASGTSNKWEGKLTDEDLARYDERCAALLSPEDAAWLNWGDRREA